MASSWCQVWYQRCQGEKYGHFHSQISSPSRQKVTYGKVVCEVKPGKEEKERTRLTVCGNLLDLTGDLSAPTASVTTAKCVFNGLVSTPGERCLLADIKHFYSNNILPDPEFMRIPLKIIPQYIIDTYDLTALVNYQEWIYMRMNSGSGKILFE